MTASDTSDSRSGLFELVTRAADVAYYEWVPGSEELHFSTALHELFGYDPDIWTRSRAWETFHPDDRAGYRAARIAYLKSGEERAEFVYRSKDARGDWRWQRDQTTVERDADGRVVRLVGAVSDITEAKQREAENARLLDELQQRTDQLARRNTEFSERIAQQSATIDVLKAMSASPGDPQPTFDLIVRYANELCGGSGAGLFEFDGSLVHFRALDQGVSDDPAAWAQYRARWPMAPTRGSITCRAILDRQIVQVADTHADPEAHPDVKALGYRSQLSVPMIRDGKVIGVISLGGGPGGFTDSQIALLQTFAEQAAIAITGAETHRKLHESLERQTATAEVLRVINANPGNLTPVFETMLAMAMRLCEAAFGEMYGYDGECFPALALLGLPDAYAASRMAAPVPPTGGTFAARLAAGERVVHIVDLRDEDAYRSGSPARRAMVDPGGARTTLAIALRKDDKIRGAIVIYRQEVRSFSNKQIALLENFAAQAVIAMENARLLTEQREALEQQTATAEVLQVINANPGNLTPVFDAVLERALQLCAASFGTLLSYDGERIERVALLGVPPAFAEWSRRNPPAKDAGLISRGIESRRPVQATDVMTDAFLATSPSVSDALVELGGIRALLQVPLLKDGAVVGFIAIFRREPGVFPDQQVALLEGFAAQAVIAMENARLLNEVRQRQEELRITFENMGDGVAMFDATRRLVAWNRKFQEIFTVPDELLEQQRTYADYIRYLAERGDYGAGADPDEQARRLTAHAGERHDYERTRPDGRVIEIRQNPVPSGGFVLMFSDITERKRSEAEIRAARDAAEAASRTIEAAYRDLKAAQANLIQAEKMASLGQLTSGIAHEIKNPLNFVNNFASLSVELLDELKETAAPGVAALDQARRADIADINATLTSNLEKIVEHGKRADGIVKSMLEHSRGASGERRTVDLNTLADEALSLAYHGARAQDQSFDITLERDFEPGLAAIELSPQDVTRVLLNLFSNGFYAARKRRTSAESGFEPTLKVTTRDRGNAVEIRVRDNGTGIPADIRDKLFQPFFTTKPTGEGTGLGLSISYDVVTQQHGGTITVESEVGAYSEFTITLPRVAAAASVEPRLRPC